MKRRIRLTENDLHRIVRNSIKKELKEAFNINPKIDLSKKERQGILPYIVYMLKVYRDFDEKLKSIYDNAYGYFDTSNAFAYDLS